MWSRNKTFASATCSLQLAKASAATLSKNKASAATLPQQEETRQNDSADVQRGGVNISGFLGAKVSWPSWRYPFDEFELLVRAFLRALHH